MKTFDEFQPKPSDTESIEQQLANIETISEKAMSTLKMVFINLSCNFSEFVVLDLSTDKRSVGPIELNIS